MNVVYCYCFDITSQDGLTTHCSETIELDLPKSEKEVIGVIQTIYTEIQNSYVNHDINIKSINQITTVESLKELMKLQKTPESLSLGDK